MNEHNLPPAGNPASEFPFGQSSFRQRILVVEEEDDIRQLNAEVLRDAGYQVEVAEDGAAAWAALQRHNYDLLIIDQFLPKLSGVELLKKIHTARLTLPVIMATSILPTSRTSTCSFPRRRSGCWKWSRRSTSWPRSRSRPWLWILLPGSMMNSSRLTTRPDR